ncbi:MAG: M20/M25/M40 family metallo-hydrolase, partial [Steroidobacteraceae bacterium]
MRFFQVVLCAFLCSAGLCCAGQALGGPSATERALVKRIQAQEPSSIALLEELVNINSGTMNFAGVRRVADLLRPRFAALGCKVRWEDGTAFGRAGHLIAEHPGRGRHVLLIGHLDTVFEPNHPFQRFERVDAQTVRGPGTSDMKGGLVVALAALTALREAQALDGMHITMVMIGDEEDSGRPLSLARASLVEAAKAADVAIGLENGADDPKTALTARRGYTGWQIDVKARSAHSSQIFTDEVGAGAIYELA